MYIVKMSIKHEKICTLCLKAVRNKFVEVDAVMKQIMDILVFKLDLNRIRRPIICWHCVEIAKKCLRFKLTCLSTEQNILLISAGKENAKYDIKVICKESEHLKRIVDEDLDICRICMIQLEKNSSFSFDTLRIGTAMFEMISGYLPEMDVNIINNPMICTSCRGNLNCYLNFVVNCLDTEGKIKAFCKKDGTDRAKEGNLDNVLDLLFKDILDCPEKYSQTCTFKGKFHMFGDTDCVYPEAYSGLIKHEELDIKEVHLEGNSYKIRPEMRVDMFDKETLLDTISLHTSEGKQHIALKNHIRIHKTASRCKEQSNINSNKIYKCSWCAYKTKYKCNLNSHMLVHKDVSELKMHKCLLCAYEAKEKYMLKRHMLVHKDVSELKMHKCPLCAHKTKRKNDLKVHMLVHKDHSEITMYKCLMCAYEAKEKYKLKRHMLVHKDVSEIKMHKCTLCTYETKYNRSLTKHILVHKDDSEIKMHKCSLCPYEAKHKSNLGNHMLVHKDISEITMHRCSLCTYVAKYKCNFERHMLIHKEISEINMYKCSLCAYKTKYKSSLTKHILVHKDVSEIKMYRCALCAYETKYKRSLEKHMLVHKDATEIKMHTCSLCAYESKHKGNLKKHMLVHKDNFGGTDSGPTVEATVFQT